MARRNNRSGLVSLSDLQGYGRRRPTSYSARAGGKNRDWFRIENASVQDGEDSDTAKIYIYDEIGFWGTDAQSFVEQISLINKDKIELHLNSPGGEIFDGIAIYNALKAHKATVTVIVDSLAASAASFIAQAGDKVIMNRAATMMIHDGSGLCWGTEQDMLDTADILGRLSNTIADIYAQRAGETQEFWRNVMRQEAWYNATEAVDAGLADEVVDNPAGDDAENKWDLSVFNYEGRESAPSPQQIRELVFANMARSKSGTPQNNEPSEADPSVTEPNVEPTPVEPTVPDAPVEPGTQETEPLSVEDPAPAGAPEGEPSNRAGVVLMVNGVPATSMAQVQAHINALEGAISEQRIQNRRDFVKNLCESNKIMASQVSALEEFALELSDKQYEKWCASWDAATSLGSLSKNVANNESVPEIQPGNSATDQTEDEIEIALGVVRMNKRANMPQDRLEKSPSYQKLVAANALDRL